MNPATITDRKSYINYLLSLGLSDWDLKRKLSEFDLKTKKTKEDKESKKEITTEEKLEKDRDLEVNRLLMLGLEDDDLMTQIGDWDKKTGYDKIEKERNFSLFMSNYEKELFQTSLFNDKWDPGFRQPNPSSKNKKLFNPYNNRLSKDFKEGYLFDGDEFSKDGLGGFVNDGHTDKAVAALNERYAGLGFEIKSEKIDQPSPYMSKHRYGGNMISITAPNGKKGVFHAISSQDDAIRSFINENQDKNQTEKFLRARAVFTDLIKDNIHNIIKDNASAGSEPPTDTPLKWFQKNYAGTDFYNDVREDIIDLYGEQRGFEQNWWQDMVDPELLEEHGLGEYAQGKTFDKVISHLVEEEKRNTKDKKQLELVIEAKEGDYDAKISGITNDIIKYNIPESAKPIAKLGQEIIDLKRQLDESEDKGDLAERIKKKQEEQNKLLSKLNENDEQIWFDVITGKPVNTALQTEDPGLNTGLISMDEMASIARGEVAQKVENTPYDTLKENYESFALMYDSYDKYIKSETININVSNEDGKPRFGYSRSGSSVAIEDNLDRLIQSKKAKWNDNGDLKVNLDDFLTMFGLSQNQAGGKEDARLILYNSVKKADQGRDINTFFGTTIDNPDDLAGWVKQNRLNQLTLETDLRGWIDSFLLNTDPKFIEKNEASLFVQGIIDNTTSKLFIPEDERGYTRGIASNHDNDRLERIQSVIADVNASSGYGEKGKAAVVFDQDQLDNFEMSFAEEFWYGTGSFVPMLAEIAAVSYATGGIMSASGAAGALSRMNTVRYLNVGQKGVKGAKYTVTHLTHADVVDRAKRAGMSVKKWLDKSKLGQKLTKVSGNTWQKGAYLMAYAGLEEGKMQALDPLFGTDMPTGAGFGFYLGGAAARALTPWRFTGNAAVLNPFLEKNVLGGVGGAVAAEVAAPLEAVIADLADHKDWKAFTEEHYKDYSTVQRRLIMNTMMFGLIGAHHWNLKTDFKSMAGKAQLMGDARAKAELAKLDWVRTKDKKYLDKYFEHYNLYENLMNQQKVSEQASKYDNIDVLMRDTRGLMNNFNMGYQKAHMGEGGKLGPKMFDFKIQNNRNGIDKGNVHQVDFSGKIPKIVIDARKLKPGILPHEIYHTVMRARFKSDLGMAKALRNKIQKPIDRIYKELTTDIAEGQEGTTLYERIKELYEKTQGKESLDEEYAANVVGLLQVPEFRRLAVSENMIGDLQQVFKGLGETLFYDTNLGKLKVGGKTFQERFSPDLKKADDVIGFLARLGKSWGKGVYDPVMIKKFENIIVSADGKKLIDMKSGKTLGSKKMAAKEVKEIENQVYKSLQESLSKEYKGDKNKFLNTELSFKSILDANGKLINKKPVDDMLDSDFATKLGGGFHPQQNRGLLEFWTHKLYDKTALDQRGMYKSGPNPRLDFKRDLMVEIWNLIKTKYIPSRQALDKYLSVKGTFTAFEYAKAKFDQVHMISKELEGISTKMEKAAGGDLPRDIVYEFGDNIKKHNEKNLINLAVAFGLTPTQVTEMDNKIKEGISKVLKDLPKISDEIQRDAKGKKVDSFRERLEDAIGDAIKANVKDLVNYKHVEGAKRPVREGEKIGKPKNYDDFLFDYYNTAFNSIELANIETTKRATGSVLHYPNFFKKTGTTAKFTSTGNRANNPINMKRDVKLPEFLAHHLGIKGAKEVLDRYGVEYKESDFMTWDRTTEKMVPQQQDIRFSPAGKKASYKGERKYTIEETIRKTYAKQRARELLKEKENPETGETTQSDLAKSIIDKYKLEKVIKENYIDDVIIELQVGKPDILAAKGDILDAIRKVEPKYENKRFLADILIIRDMAADDPRQDNPIVKIIQDWLKQGYGQITMKDVLAEYGTKKHYDSYSKGFKKNPYTEKDAQTYLDVLGIDVSVKELNSVETSGFLYTQKGQRFLNSKKLNDYIKYIKLLAPYLPKNLNKGQMEGLLGLQQKAGTAGYSREEMNAKGILNDVTGKLVTRKDLQVYDKIKDVVSTKVKNEYDNINFDKIFSLAQMETAYKKVFEKKPGWKKTLRKYFSKESNKGRPEFLFQWGIVKENFIKDAKSKEDLLGRIQHLHQMGAHNSSVGNGDRAWVTIETVFVPKGKELPKYGSPHDYPLQAAGKEVKGKWIGGNLVQLNRIKLEHLKSSLQNSFESGSAQTRLTWSENGRNILENYKGAYSTRDRLDIIDILGGKTNQAGLARLILRADELGNYYTVESGFKESLRDVNWKNIAKEAGLNLREADNVAFKDVVAEEMILPTETSKLRLKNAVKNKKQTKLLHKNNVELAEKAGIMGAKDLSNFQIIDKLSKKDKALENARKINKERKGISVLDFDDTVVISKSKVIVNMPYYAPGKMNEAQMRITPAEFAKRHKELEEMGAAFDFSEFTKVVGGKKGPLFDKLQKAVNKFGNENVFILTARPQESAAAIHAFLKGLGVELKIENITGLENGAAQAKADWVINKAAEGYNDFYFADDALANVKAVKVVLDAVDVKSKIQQARVMASKGLNEEFNKIIEKKTGISFQKKYSPAKAQTVGARKGKFNFFIPYGAEDFTGLLYTTLSKGKTGDSQMAWYKEKLITPYAKAEGNMSRERMSMNNDYVALKSNLGVGKKLRSEINEDGFTHEHAVRVWIWNKQGMKVPDLSKADLKLLTKTVENDPKLKAFAEGTMRVMKGDEYYKPGEYWLNGGIQGDMLNVLNKVKRPRHLQEFQDNADVIFSKQNLQKLEAAFGTNYRDAMENILGRMKSGVNRQWQPNSMEGKLLNWVNGSVGTMMFLNTRSALLQTISAVNFINWSDNNPLAAAKALANGKQWSSDFNKLFNSDYLVERRKGLKININEAELAEMAKKGGVQGAINYLLKKGFILTQIADSFAIASGGASMYRNRINTYKKKGLSDKKAEETAFRDFMELSEISQQSSRPDKISAQQAGNLGRLILAFANTPMQYTRLQKRAIQDLIAGRGDTKANVSKLIYYGFVQNLIFNALQQALFAVGFDEESFDEREKTARYASVANGMMDTTLRGTGVYGAGAAAIKNIMFKLWEEGGKKNPNFENAAWEIFDFSPPIASKVAKIRGAFRSYDWDAKEIKSRGPWDINNPAYMASARLVSAATNIPIDRALQKTYNTQSALEEDREIWQRVSNFSGYTDYNIGVPDKEYKKKSKPLTEEQKRLLNKKKKPSFGETLYGETIYGETIYE